MSNLLAHKITRRDLLRWMGVGAAGAALAACVPPTPAPAPAAAPTEAPQEVEKPAPAAEKVVLTFGHHWEAAFQPHQEKFDQMWLERHPGVEIKVTYNTWSEHNRIVPTWAAAGELPDIIYVHGRYAFPWNHEGILISIQDYVDQDVEFDVKGIWEEALKLYRYKGKQYEIPYDHGPVILGYNKDLFDAAGLPYPDDTWTMDDLLENAKKLTKEGQWGWGGYYSQIVQLGNEWGITLVGPWGGEVFNEEETKLLLDSPECLTALQWWADMLHVHKVAPLPAESQAFPAGPWVAGVTAMFALASWGTPTLREFANFQWDVAPWPKGPKGRKCGSFGSGFGITRDCKHPDVAWSYLREYLSKEGMEFMWGSSGRGSPARKAAYESWMNSPVAPEHAEYYLDALENYAVTGRPYQTLAGGEILDIFDRNTSLVQTGEKTVEEAVQAIIKEGTPVLEEAYKRLMG
ncbi:MAG: sugar ABC transporter substrate-binding protein [Anaerolineae bacterium]|nr:sugar ABC transporter substrate-binding protein [Anaerolineae bacterium]MDW8099203.1 sugar ABC transporter substrate-binding protein [Anaerolineae bacterium]